jgi:hypothetical protein
MTNCSIAVERLPALRRSPLGPAIGLVAGLCLPASSRAQSVRPDSAIAQGLFEEGRTLMSAQRFEEACAKFAESQHLEPASGTLLNLAVCHEKQGKTATAWAEYTDVVAATRKEGNAERARIAADRVHSLEPRLCRLTVVPADPSSRGPIVLEIDGIALGAAAWNAAIPVDPGEHRVELRMPGKKPWAGTVALKGDAATSVITVLVSESDAAIAQAPPAASASTESRKRTAYVIGAMSLAAMGAGTYFGLRAKANWDERNDHCPGNVCDAEAVSAGRSARNLALASDVAFGMALIGAGFTAYFALAPAPPGQAQRQIWVSASVERISVGGAF